MQRKMQHQYRRSSWGYFHIRFSRLRTSSSMGISDPLLPNDFSASNLMAFRRATHVPVGEDQSQHLELSRTLAASFNHHFSPTFPLPETLLSPAKRIMSLRDPLMKMSKSSHPSSRISLTDSPQDIKTKLNGAVTDSLPGITYNPNIRPGVSNLIEIYGHFSKRNDFATIAEEFDNSGNGMKGLKQKVAEAVSEGLAGVRRKWERMIKEEGYLDEVSTRGAEKAAESAGRVLDGVKKSVGIL